MTLSVDAQITFLYTPDLQRAVPFYEDVLGLQLVHDQGTCRIYLVTDNRAYLGICEGRTPRTPDGVIFTFVTQDVDAWYERITAKGFICEHAPKVNADYGIYHFFMKDPNGYLIEVQRFLDTNWKRSSG